MQARAPDDRGVNLLRRKDAVEPTLDPVENARAHEPAHGHTQRIRIPDLEEYGKIRRMEEGLLGPRKQRDAFARYVMRRCTNMYIIIELNGGIKRIRSDHLPAPHSHPL